MIAHLKGEVIYKSGFWLVLEVGGVGYRVEMSTDGVQIGDALSLFIYHYVREDAQKLFGFKRSEELELFEMLISVSGVGPKTAVVVLNTFSVENLLAAIRDEDTAMISKVKGLGKKSAERIVLELKGKVEDFALSLGISINTDGSGNKKEMLKNFEESVWMDASEALISLGYTKDEIRDAFLLLYENMPSDNTSDLTSGIIVRKALAYLSS